MVEANIDDIWQLVKVWCPSLWIFSIKGTPCSFHVLVRLFPPRNRDDPSVIEPSCWVDGSALQRYYAHISKFWLCLELGVRTTVLFVKRLWPCTGLSWLSPVTLPHSCHPIKPRVQQFWFAEKMLLGPLCPCPRLTASISPPPFHLLGFRRPSNTASSCDKCESGAASAGGGVGGAGGMCAGHSHRERRGGREVGFRGRRGAQHVMEMHNRPPCHQSLSR